MKRTIFLLAFSPIFLNINSCETTKEENPVLIENLQEAVDTIPDQVKNAGNPPKPHQLEGESCGTPTPPIANGMTTNLIDSDKAKELKEHYRKTICSEDGASSQHVIYQYCYKVYSFKDINSLPDLYGRSYQDYEKMKENNETFHQLCHGLSENLDFLQTALAGQKNFEIKEYKDDSGNRYIQYQINGTHYTDRYPLSEESRKRVVAIQEIENSQGDLKDLIPKYYSEILLKAKKLKKRMVAMKKHPDLCKITSQNGVEDSRVSYDEMLGNSIREIDSIQNKIK